MTDIYILVDGTDALPGGEFSASPAIAPGIAALQEAIRQQNGQGFSHADLQPSLEEPLQPHVVAGADAMIAAQAGAAWSHPWVIPLTLNIPEQLRFTGEKLYQRCRDVTGLRQWVSQQWHYTVGAGEFWLPIVLTAKGALYGEVIGLDSSATASPYTQPLHLPDRYRQPVYQLGQRLLRSLSAPSAVYLLQFGFQDEQVCFDRLYPFPALPAIASLGVQSPDLFTCHWRCLTHQPILDLTIPGTVAHRVYQPVSPVSKHPQAN